MLGKIYKLATTVVIFFPTVKAKMYGTSLLTFLPTHVYMHAHTRTHIQL